MYLNNFEVRAFSRDIKTDMGQLYDMVLVNIFP